MPQAQYLKGTEDRKTSVFLPDLPWYLPVGAVGRLAELQAEAFHGAPLSHPASRRPFVRESKIPPPIPRPNLESNLLAFYLVLLYDGTQKI